MAKKLMDSVAMAAKANALEEALSLTNSGVILVATEASFMDAKWIRDNQDVVREMLETGKMVLHFFNDPDKMVQKAFTWSSFDGLTTEAGENFLEVAEKLPEDWDTLTDLYDLAMEFGQERGSWEMGEWKTVQALTEADAEMLGVPVDANRSTVLAACQEKGVDFAPFNERYCAGLISQHLCDGLF